MKGVEKQMKIKLWNWIHNCKWRRYEVNVEPLKDGSIKWTIFHKVERMFVDKGKDEKPHRTRYEGIAEPLAGKDSVSIVIEEGFDFSSINKYGIPFAQDCSDFTTTVHLASDDKESIDKILQKIKVENSEEIIHDKHTA